MESALRSGSELEGWKEFFERKYGSEVAEGLYRKILEEGGIPFYFGVLEK